MADELAKWSAEAVDALNRPCPIAVLVAGDPPLERLLKGQNSHQKPTDDTQLSIGER